MTEERFTEIAKEYGYIDEDIRALWLTRPEDDLDEVILRKTFQHFAVVNQPTK